MGSPTIAGSEGSESVSALRSSKPSAERGRLVVIAGPSGAGKSTIVEGLLRHRPFTFSVSATTRPPRPGEVDGVHYHFVTLETFRQMVEDGELLEWAEYGANLYGTPLSPVVSAIDRGHDVLLEIEIQGARQIAQVYPRAVMVFVEPPSMLVLEQRLRSRGDTDDAAIERRLEIARREMSEAPALFDHIVVNDQVDRAIEEVLRIVSAEVDPPGVG